MKRPAITNGGSMRLYQNKSINPALRIPLNRGNKLFSRFSVMQPLTNGVHYRTPIEHVTSPIDPPFPYINSQQQTE